MPSSVLPTEDKTITTWPIAQRMEMQNIVLYFPEIFPSKFFFLVLYYTNERVSEDGPQYGSEEGHYGEAVEQDGGIRVAEADHSGDEQDQDS